MLVDEGGASRKTGKTTIHSTKRASFHPYHFFFAPQTVEVWTPPPVASDTGFLTRMQAFNNEIGELFSMKICYSHRRNNPTCILLWHWWYLLSDSILAERGYQTQGLWHGGPWPIKCLEDGELIGDPSSQLNWSSGARLPKKLECGLWKKTGIVHGRRLACLGQDWR